MKSSSQQPPSKPSEQVALEDCLLKLLRGIQNHAVVAEESDAEGFRAQLAALESQFKGPDDAHHLVESAVELLDKYGTQTSQAIARQKSGLLTAATELSEVVKTLPDIHRFDERFSRLEEQIQAISTKDDLAAIKAHLSADIASARADTLEESHKISELFSAVAGKLDHTADRGPSQVPGQMTNPKGRPSSLAHIPDQLTGLASRGAAEAELARVCSQSEDCYLALFVVKRLALINAKFGYSRGDQVLLKVVVHLSQSMPDYKSLFRWAPCAFLTRVPPNVSYKELRGKVQLIELTRLTATLEWEGRSAMVPVAIDCRIVSAKDFGTTSDLFLRLDTLAADA